MSKSIKKAGLMRAEICSLLKDIERGIKYGSRPVSEITAECRTPLLLQSGLISHLTKGEYTSGSIERCLRLLSDREVQKLSEFFSLIGKSTYSEKELLLCSSYISYFEEALKKSEKESAVKALLYKKIGIICGILAAIIFI